jgi:hypothetical protein
MVAATAAMRAAGGSIAAHDVSLRTSSPADVTAAMQTLRASGIAWVDDGLCAQRAMVGAHLVNRSQGADPSGITDAAAAAVVMQSATLTHQLANGWSYHAAPVMRTTDGLVVLDPLTAPAPQPLAAWRAALDARSEPQRRSPLQSVGYSMPRGLRVHAGTAWHTRDAASAVARAAADAAR